MRTVIQQFSWYVAGLFAVTLIILAYKYQSQPSAIGSAAPSLGAISYGKAPATVVLALQIGCHYCEESMPFYVALAAEERKTGAFRTVVVMPDEPAAAEGYLRDHRLPFPVISDENMFSTWRLRGTPTLLVIDNRGLIRGDYSGALTLDKQGSVFASLRAAARTL